MAIALIQRPAAPAPRPKAIARWLLFVACLVFAMVVVGGITRLTESGLSIVRWDPLSGAIPPIGDAAWQQAFEQYKASPQYLQINNGMTLADFKSIYFWEFVHRLLARLIGLAFALPLLFFWWKRAIPKGYGWKLGGILALGALQGVIGWWMVASGLVDRPGFTDPQFLKVREYYKTNASQQAVVSPQDVAAAVLFLASERAALIAGETIVVDGGFSAGRLDFPRRQS